MFFFNNLSQFTNIKHFVSTRSGGMSVGEKGSLNLSFKVGDDPQNVIANRTIVAEFLGLSVSNLVFPDQTHTSNVQVVNSLGDLSHLENTDAVITNKPQICLCVMSADCVPILLFDKKRNVIAAIHAGWRGTVAEIVTNTIKKMHQEYGSEAKDIVASIGPSISAEVYEVGKEVIDKVRLLFGSLEGIIELKSNEKGLFNLWEANKQLLMKSGVKEENIEVAGICTFKNSDTYFSHRNSSNTGRFAAGICLYEN